MKTFVAIFLAFAVLKMILADFQVDTPTPVGTFKLNGGFKPNNDLGITENLTDILPNQAQIVNESIIPTLKELTNKSNPLQVAQEIRKITDPEKRNQLISELKQAWTDNEGTLPGKFYETAYTSLQNPNEGAKYLKYWQNELQKATDNVIQSGKQTINTANNGIAQGFGNVRKIVQYDPLGLALMQGDSVLLTILSDASKNTGKILDLAYDAAGNVVAIHRKLTAPLNNIPLFGDMKNNIDGFVAEGIRRGKLVNGAFANTGTNTFATLANDSEKKAEKRGTLLREFTKVPNSSFE